MSYIAATYILQWLRVHMQVGATARHYCALTPTSSSDPAATRANIQNMSVCEFAVCSGTPQPVQGVDYCMSIIMALVQFLLQFSSSPPLL